MKKKLLLSLLLILCFSLSACEGDREEVSAADPSLDSSSVADSSLPEEDSDSSDEGHIADGGEGPMDDIGWGELVPMG